MDRKTLGLVVAFLALGIFAQGRGCFGPSPVDPDVDPVVDDAPIPAAGLHVMIVEETADRPSLPMDQLAILMSTQIREHVTAGGGEFRQFDEDQDMALSSPVWREAMARPRSSVPWWIVSHAPHGGVEGPLPPNLEEAMAVVRDWTEPVTAGGSL